MAYRTYEIVDPDGVRHSVKTSRKVRYAVIARLRFVDGYVAHFGASIAACRRHWGANAVVRLIPVQPVEEVE